MLDLSIIAGRYAPLATTRLQSRFRRSLCCWLCKVCERFEVPRGLQRLSAGSLVMVQCFHSSGFRELILLIFAPPPNQRLKLAARAGVPSHATPSVFNQRHIGRVLRSSCNARGRRLASSRGREHRPGRCPPPWPSDVRNDGGSVAVAADGSDA